MPLSMPLLRVARWRRAAAIDDAAMAFIDAELSLTTDTCAAMSASCR